MLAQTNSLDNKTLWTTERAEKNSEVYIIALEVSTIYKRKNDKEQ